MNKAPMNKKLKQITNFYRIDENIATSGQPKAEQFKEIFAEGFEVIFNLALSDSPNAIEDEGKIINELNMEYVHIPVDFRSPSLEDLKLFFKHTFMFLYHTIKCQIPVADAHRHIDAVWQPDSLWQDFIRHSLDTYSKQP